MRLAGADWCAGWLEVGLFVILVRTVRGLVPLRRSPESL